CNAQATLEDPSRSSPQKISLYQSEHIVHVPDIKLIRTDTTLDLSQKAEKSMTCHVSDMVLILRPVSTVETDY
ncbi:hypothetical protein SORBI_3008G145700, partial [Sorghum bicolor]